MFGFITRGERTLFRLLIGAVTGVGPKLALNVLSSMTINGFCDAIVDGDVKTLSKISGIGKRTAERMIVELRDKIKKIGDDGNTLDLILKSSPGTALPPAAADAIAALETLGIRNDTPAKSNNSWRKERRDPHGRTADPQGIGSAESLRARGERRGASGEGERESEGEGRAS